MNWKEIWNDPMKIVDVEIENDKAAAYLQAIQKRIKEETKKEKKIAGGRYVFEGETKKKLLDEIKEIDSELATRIAKMDNKDDIVNAMDMRLKELKEKIKLSEKMFEKAIEDEEKVVGEGSSIMERYYDILIEIKNNYKKQLENLMLNKKYEDDMITSIKANTYKQRLDYFHDEIVKNLKRITQNKELEMKVIKLREQIKELKKKADLIRPRFEQDSEMIQKGKLNLLSIFGFKNKKEDPLIHENS